MFKALGLIPSIIKRVDPWFPRAQGHDMDKYLLRYNTYLLLHPLTFVLRPTKTPFHQVHFLKTHFVQWPDLAFVQSLPMKLLLPFKKTNLKAHELNNMYK